MQNRGFFKVNFGRVEGDVKLIAVIGQLLNPQNLHLLQDTDNEFQLDGIDLAWSDLIDHKPQRAKGEAIVADTKLAANRGIDLSEIIAVGQMFSSAV